MSDRKKYSAELYKWYKDNGICVTCGSNKAELGRVRCGDCLDKNAEVNRKRREYLKYTFRDTAEKNRNYQKELRESRKAKGLCIWCAKPLSKYSKCFCMDCRIKNQRKNQERYREKYGIPRVERPDYGLCYRCGKKIDGGTLCEACKMISRDNLPQFSEGWYQYHRKMNRAIFGD